MAFRDLVLAEASLRFYHEYDDPDGSTAIIDSSPNLFHATPIVSPTPVGSRVLSNIPADPGGYAALGTSAWSTPADGVFGDGVTDWLHSTPFTLEYVFSADFPYFLAYRSSGSALVEYMLHSSTYVMTLVLQDDAGGSIKVASGNITTAGVGVSVADLSDVNKILVVAATYDGSGSASGVKLLVNGQALSTTIIFNSLSAVNFFGVDDNISKLSLQTGLMHESALFWSELSVATLLSHYDSLENIVLIEFVAEHDEILVGVPHMAEHDVITGSRFVAEHDCTVPISEVFIASHEAPLPIATQFIAENDQIFDILDVNPYTAEHTTLWNVEGHVTGMVQDTAVLTFKGSSMDIESCTVSADEGGHWQSSVQLVREEDYLIIGSNDAFTITLNGDNYEFIRDDKSISRVGTVEVGLTVNGVSPTAANKAPRTDLVTKTWTTAVSSRVAAEEIVGPIEWLIDDWVLPAYRLSVEDSQRYDVADKIVQAAGGVLETKRDGTYRARPLYPVTIPDYYTSLDYVLISETDDLYELSETVSINEEFNLFRVSDNSDSGGDRLEYEGDGLEGVAKAYPSPWRDVTLSHTRGSVVSMTRVGEVIREEESGIIEVIAGKFSTSYPVYDISSVSYLADDLGAVTYTQGDSSLFTSVDGYSLVEVNYRTRSIDYDVVSTDETKAQILMEDGTDIPTTGLEILVKRGEADKPGDDILDPLLSATAPAISRGRAEIDKATPSISMSDTTKYKDYEMGKLARVQDSLQGETWAGKIVGIEHAYSNHELLSTLSLRRPQ